MVRLVANAKKIPILPRNTENPVGHARLQQQTVSRLKRGLRDVRAWLLERFRDIETREITINASIPNIWINADGSASFGPTYTVNETRYEYLISVDELRLIVEEIRRRLNIEVPPEYMVQQAVVAYQAGTGTAVAQLAALTSDYTREITQVLSSEPWQRRVALMRGRVFETMEGFNGDTATELSRVLSQAVEDGLNPRSVVKDLRERFGVAENRAERIARTEIGSALRRASRDETQDARERLGINTQLLWLSALSPTTRASHARKHGRVLTAQEVAEFYSQGAEAINCDLPGTKVQGRFVAGSKAAYDGEAINIVTRNGNALSVTPNHPLMTDRGLIAATKLNVGDNLLTNTVKAEPNTGVSNLDGKLAAPCIEDVFCSLVDVGHSRSTRVGAVDFHGDARRMDKYIDIVNIKGELVTAINSKLCKALDNVSLVSTDPHFAHILATRSFGGVAVSLTPASLMRRIGSAFSKIAAKLGIAERGRFTHVSPLKPGLGHAAVNGSPGYSVLLAKLLYGFTGNVLGVNLVDANTLPKTSVSSLRNIPGCIDGPLHGLNVNANRFGNTTHALPGLIALDDIVSIDRFHYSGPVYDLEEVSGLMIANNLISSNCKCSQQPVLLDENDQPILGPLEARLEKQRKMFEPGEGV